MPETIYMPQDPRFAAWREALLGGVDSYLMGMKQKQFQTDYNTIVGQLGQQYPELQNVLGNIKTPELGLQMLPNIIDVMRLKAAERTAGANNKTWTTVKAKADDPYGYAEGTVYRISSDGETVVTQAPDAGKKTSWTTKKAGQNDPYGFRPGTVYKVSSTGETTVVQAPEDPKDDTAMPGDFSKWTAEEKKWWFDNTKATGTKPNFGWGKAAAANRSRYDQEYAQYLMGKGITGAEAGTESQQFKADSMSLRNLTKGMDTVMAFEKGVQQSLNLITELSNDFSRGRFPKANQFSQIFKYHTGDPKVKALKNAVTTAATEYMKVTTAGTGISAAELTQGAQQRAKEILDAADNAETLKASIEVMRREMEIKKNAFEDQRQEITNRMNGRNIEPAVGYLERAQDKEAAKKELRKQGWSQKEVDLISRKAGVAGGGGKPAQPGQRFQILGVQ